MKFFKNIAKYSILTLTVFGLNACFDDPGTDIILKEKFVSFGSQSNLAIVEANLTDTLFIELSYAQSSDMSVTYEVVTSGAIEGIDFEIDAPNPIVIPAGKHIVKLPINVTNNLVYDGEDPRIVTITLTGVSANGVDINGVKTAKITIIDDDCPFDIADWVGVYTVDEAFTAGVNAPNGFSDFFGESYQVELAINPADPNLLSAVLTNSAGFNEYFVPGTVIVFNTCPGTVTFPAGPPRLADFVGLTVATSSFDDTNFTIRVDGAAGGFGPYGFTLTKQ